MLSEEKIKMLKEDLSRPQIKYLSLDYVDKKREFMMNAKSVYERKLSNLKAKGRKIEEMMIF